MVNVREGQPSPERKNESTLLLAGHIVTASRDLLAYVDKDFTYQAVNPAYIEAFGKTGDRFIGQTISEMFEDDFFNNVIRPHAELCLKGKAVNYQAWFNFIESEPKYMDIYYYPHTEKNNAVVGFVVNGRDITEQKQAEDSLLESETKFKTLFQTSPDPTWIIDENNIFILCNKAAAKALGYDSIVELQSTHPSQLSPEFQPDGQSSLNKANEMMACARHKGVHRFEWEHRHRSGECFPVEVTLSCLKIKGKEHLYCIWRDISERKKSEHALQLLNKKLESLSLQDGLTGIANRRMFDTRLHLEWDRCMREKQPLSLIMIDVDSFKQYNDYFGHLPGDKCLKTIAEKLFEVLKRAVDLCARYGGDEFALLLPNTNLTQATHLAEKCREAIYQLNIPHKPSAVCEFVTISAGAGSIYPIKNASHSSLIEAADKALLLAKKKGRNTVISS